MEKIGRNDPCSCGSGKKVKKCCGGQKPLKKIQAQMIQPSQSKISSLFYQAHPQESKKPE